MKHMLALKYFSLYCEIKVHTVTFLNSQNGHLASIHFGCPPRNISECEFTGYIVPHSTPYIQATFPVSFSRSCVYADLASVPCFVYPLRLGKQITTLDYPAT